MAKMKRKERIKKYAERILLSKNKQVEASSIFDEIDSLVWSKTQQPLSKTEKLEIVNELREYIEDQRLSKSIESRRIFEATDNSGVMDIINTIENKLKERK